MMTRIAVYGTLVMVLSALGHQWDSTEFWCLLGLFWCIDTLGKMEGVQIGMDMSKQILINANRILDQARALKTLKGYPKEKDEDITVL
jgi:hypothetical protein